MESFLLIIFTTALITALVKLMMYHYKRLDLYKAGNKIPGPGPVLPIIGNLHLLFGKPEDTLKKFTLILDSFESAPVRFWFGHKLCIVLSDPEQIKIILHGPKFIEKDELYKFIRPWLGEGLFSAPANKWKVHRKLIMPTFHPKILENFIGRMNKGSKILVKVMESQVNGDEFSIISYIARCTLDILCETMMGVSVNLQTNIDSTYVKAVNRIMEILSQRPIKIWLHPDITYKFTKLARDQKECIKYLHNHTNNVIEQKRQLYFEKMNCKDDFTPTTELKRKTFLDLLMELSKEGTNLTNEEIRDEVNTMMVAGYDTTATIDTFVVYLLANYPEVQNKCYEEIVEIYGDKIKEETEIEKEDLNRMKYLERVIKETLRLFPVGPILTRQLSDDLDIGGGYVLPKSCTVILAVLKLHRSADLWDDPLSFNPDRFLPEEVAKRHPYAYIPFSAGPRNCIGMKYAMMSMKILLATLMRNYVFIKDKHVNIEDIEIKNDVIIKSINPLTVKIKRRQHIVA